MRFEQLGERQPVALVRLVIGAQHRVELADQRVQLRRFLGDRLDRDGHATFPFGRS